MFDPIFFDLDGTLTASHPGVTKCAAYALAAYGIEAKPEDLMAFIGPPLLQSFRKYYGFDEATALAAVEKYRERYIPIGAYEAEVFPGIAALLGELRAAGRTVAVATSKPYPQTIDVLRHFGLLDYFGEENIFAAGMDDRKNSKSAIIAEGLAAMKARGLSLENAVMVGDRCFDIEGGHKNGLPVVGVGYGYAPEGEFAEYGADYIAPTVAELRALLLGETND